MFSKNTVDTIIAPSGIFGQLALIPVSSPFLPAGARAQFCASNDFDFNTPGVQTLTPAQCAAAAAALTPADPNFRAFQTNIGRRIVETGPRLSEFLTNFFDYRAGVRFRITDSISLDVSGAYGESENRQTQDGYVSISRLRTALYTSSATTCNLGPSPTVPNPTNPNLPPLAGSGAGTKGCVPVNIFGAGRLDHPGDDPVHHRHRHQLAALVAVAGAGAAERRFRRLDALGERSDRLRGRRRVSATIRRRRPPTSCRRRPASSAAPAARSCRSTAATTSTRLMPS